MNIYLKWGLRIIGGLVLLAGLAAGLIFMAFSNDLSEAESYLPGGSEIVRTQKGMMEYKIQGSTDKYILYLHGTPGNYHTFNTDILLEKGYSIISVSRPGYYRTPITSGANLDEQAEAYNALLDTLGYEQVYVLGFSGGGPPALRFAMDYPEKVKKLVLIAPVLDSFDKEEAEASQKAFSSNFTTWMATKAFSMQFSDKTLSNMAKGYLRNTLLPVDQTADGQANDMRLYTQDLDLTFDSVSVPTALFHGTSDDMVPFTHSEAAASRIPNSELIALEGKDHFQVVFFEYHETLKLVSEYLAK